VILHITRPAAYRSGSLRGEPPGRGWEGLGWGTRFASVKRRITRLVFAAALTAGVALGLAGCGGATAGDGVTSPPSTSGT